MKSILVVLLVVLAPRVLAEESKPRQVIASPLAVLPQAEQRECEGFGETWLRIAELRDAGADKLVAIDRGTEFLSDLGRTGSNLSGMNYRPAVTQFADFVYANPKLYRGTVYLYGLSSCAISKKAPDDPQFDAAMDALDKSIGVCQSKYSDRDQIKAMAACVIDPVNARLRKWIR